MDWASCAEPGMTVTSTCNSEVRRVLSRSAPRAEHARDTDECSWNRVLPYRKKPCGKNTLRRQLKSSHRDLCAADRASRRPMVTKHYASAFGRSAASLRTSAKETYDFDSEVEPRLARLIRSPGTKPTSRMHARTAVTTSTYLSRILRSVYRSAVGFGRPSSLARDSRRLGRSRRLGSLRRVWQRPRRAQHGPEAAPAARKEDGPSISRFLVAGLPVSRPAQLPTQRSLSGVSGLSASLGQWAE